MKDKIIFWLDGDITFYSLSYYLQKKVQCDLYLIIDVPDRQKSFYENQNLVNFKKLWFYHDHIDAKNHKPDLNYLSFFEKKYEINLWELAINERIFYNYNDYYEFNDQEILSILEQECKLYETILNEIKPDFFITKETASHQQHLFYQMCKKTGINVLMLNQSKFSYRCYITQELHKFDFLKSLSDVKGENLSFSELENFLKSNVLSKQLLKLHLDREPPKLAKIKAVFQYLFISKNTNVKTNYYYFGRSKIRVLFYEFLDVLKRRYREKFINKNFLTTIEFDKPFVYMPLHVEPERSLLIAAPFYTNQIETIRHIAKSLPIEYVLCVKEHPTQGVLRGWRKISDYKKMLNIPNVKLIHPSVSSESIMKKCALVISVGGTASFEAPFYRKPSIVFSDMGYTMISSIFKLDSLEDLPMLIRKALKTKVDSTSISKYLSVLDQNSFEFDYFEFQRKYGNKFYYGANLGDVNISLSEMKNFLDEQKPVLEKLTDAYVRKINQFKNREEN